MAGWVGFPFQYSKSATNKIDDDVKSTTATITSQAAYVLDRITRSINIETA